MPPQVMALKWRPQVFADLVGQEHVTRTLQNAIRHQQLAHAYIFAGPRGVGKTTTARLFAKALNCRSPKDIEPCNACDNCQEVNQGAAMDVIEIDAASVNGIEGIRALQEQVGTYPSKGKYKVYIFDEAHRISRPAFDAFLKTLEEPPEHVIFILASTEIHNIPATIQSRCQRFEFRAMSMETLLTQLKRIGDSEGLAVDNKALYLIARTAGGSMRDAQRTLDQVVAYCGKKVSLEDVRQVLGAVETEVLLQVAEAAMRQDAPAAISIVKRMVDAGRDLEQFYRGILETFRHLAVAKAHPSAAAQLIPLSDEETERIVKLSQLADEVYLLSALRILLEQEHALRHSSYPQVVLETLVLELSRLKSLISVDEALARPDGAAMTAYPAAVNPAPPSVAETPGRASGPETGTEQGPPSGGEAGEPVLAVEEISEAVDTETSPELARVKSQWREILDKVYKLNRGLHGVLSDTPPKTFQDGTLILACKGPFHRDQVEKPENKKLIESVVEEVTALKVNLTPVVTSDRSAAPSGPSKGAADARTPQKARNEVLKPMDPPESKPKVEMKDLEKQEPFVAAVVKMFDGKVVDVKKLSRPGNGS